MTLRKFQVYFEQTNTRNIEVLAEDEDEAREKAHERLENNTFKQNIDKCQQGTFEYTYTDEVE